MEKILEIKPSQLKIVAEPNIKIMISGIVSGVAVVMYDPVRKLCGVLHAILPRCFPGYQQDAVRFVDTAIPMLLDGLIKKGAEKKRLVVKIAGGSEMISSGGSMQLGVNNIFSAKEVIGKLGIVLAGEDTGKHYRRDLAVSLDSTGYKVLIKKSGTASAAL